MKKLTLLLTLLTLFPLQTQAQEITYKRVDQVCDKRPETLSPQMKQAYDELTKALGNEAGVKVEIVCFDKGGERI